MFDLIPARQKDGSFKFYGRCPVHNWIFKGLPPITHGCKTCWEVYWFFNVAQSPEPDKQMLLEQVTEAVTHAVEEVEKGTWDFKPFDRPEINIEKDAE